MNLKLSVFWRDFSRVYNLQRGFGNKTVASSRNDKHRQCSVVTHKDAQRQSDRSLLLTAEMQFSSLGVFLVDTYK